MQNVVPVLDGPVEGPSNSEQQLHEQEKRIEISCALAAEASRRSRLLSAQCPSSPPASPTSLVPPPSADYSDSSHIMKVWSSSTCSCQIWWWTLLSVHRMMIENQRNMFRRIFWFLTSCREIFQCLDVSGGLFIERGSSSCMSCLSNPRQNYTN